MHNKSAMSPPLLGGDCAVLNAELARYKLPTPRSHVSLSYDGLDSVQEDTLEMVVICPTERL